MSAPALAATPALTPRLVVRVASASTWSVASRSQPGHQYQVTIDRAGRAECTCQSYTYRRHCAHIEAARAADRQEVLMSAPAPTALVSYQAPSVPTLPDASEWGTIVQMSRVLAASSLMPPHIKTPEAAAAIILQGRELGIGAMQALRTINLIKGRLTLAADLMAALIYARCGDRALQVVERSAERCVIDYQRPGWSAPARMVWTIEMARRAKLTAGDNWQHYPEAMLYARCVSAIGHTAFQDVIMGLYTPDEAEEIADGLPMERPRVKALPSHYQASEPGATIVTVDAETGEILDRQPTATDLSGRPEPAPTAAQRHPTSDRSIRDQPMTGQQREDIGHLVARLKLSGEALQSFAAGHGIDSDRLNGGTAGRLIGHLRVLEDQRALLKAARDRLKAAIAALELPADQSSRIALSLTGKSAAAEMSVAELDTVSDKLEGWKAGRYEVGWLADGMAVFDSVGDETPF